MDMPTCLSAMNARIGSSALTASLEPKLAILLYVT